MSNAHPHRGRLFIALTPVYLSVFLFVAGMSALQILVPVYLSERAELGAAAIGVIVGVAGTTSLIARLPVGMAYSVARGRTFLLVGGGLAALSFALVPFVHGAAAFGVLMALNGRTGAVDELSGAGVPVLAGRIKA